MNTISGLSFYDSLNRLTIGALLLIKETPSKNDGVQLFLFVVASFVIGSIFQMIVQLLTGSTFSGRKIRKDLKDTRLNLHKINLGLNWSNNPKLIKRAHDDINEPSNNTFDIKKQYLKAYYNVARNGLLMNIPILEALENFVRNLIFFFMILVVLQILEILGISKISMVITIVTIFVFFVTLWIGGLWVALPLAAIVSILFLWSCVTIDYSIVLPTLNSYKKLISCSLLIFIFYWIRIEIQYKIHFLIWEGDYYIRLLDNEQKRAKKQCHPIEQQTRRTDKQ